MTSIATLAPRIKRFVAATMVCSCCLTLAACGYGPLGLPTKGMVQTLAPVEQQTQRVYTNPEGPDDNAPPEDIVSGFYDAMPAGVQSDGYEVAREYLTKAAAADWNGDISALVYDGTPDIRRRVNAMGSAHSDDRSMVVEVDLKVVGKLDSHGLYTAYEGAQVTSLTYMLAKESNQWRISALDNGVVVSKADFEQVFRQVSVYQVDHSGTCAIPDVRWLSWRNWRTQAVKEVLADASDWLSGVVRDPNPGDVRLAVNSVPVDGSTAEVNLDGAFAELDEGERARLVRRIRMTLGDGSTEYQIKVLGAGVDYSDADSELTLGTESLPSNGVYTLTGGYVVSLSSSSPLRVGEVPGYEHAKGFVFSATGGAVLRENHVVDCLDADGKSCNQLFSGEHMNAISEGIDGEIWGIGADGRTLHVSRNGKEAVLNVSWLDPGTRIVSLAVSPEGARLALAVETDQETSDQNNAQKSGDDANTDKANTDKANTTDQTNDETTENAHASASVMMTGVARDSDGLPTALGGDAVTVSAQRHVTMLTFYNELSLVYVTKAGQDVVQEGFRQITPGPANTQRLPDADVVSIAAGQIAQVRRLAALDDSGTVRSVSGTLDGSWSIADSQVVALGEQ
ncbi:hypothetical protein [Bifidobacterium oedipodis]|uniref:GerMN domain-containing protein n=1 Tax=Bifidobacterium oedipodis TaxID=2675322 RepID=A0A7Y0HRS0_9BIFI|nr:hypothetical protein [Bifidobacterium sp. DSM 109957]NMM92823.1 hypothetical protein [Bifidobacterium sp. DSM 109957]